MRYPDGHGILRRVLNEATQRGELANALTELDLVDAVVAANDQPADE